MNSTQKVMLVLVFSCVVLPVAAAFFAPEWSEFCPAQYANLENKSYLLPEKVYWLQRRLNFEEKKKMCLSQEDQGACYSELRQSENNKNKIYYEEKRLRQEREESNMFYDSMYNRRYYKD